MPGQHTERAFETAIEHHLTTMGGYRTGDRDTFDQERGLFPNDVIAFIQKTQPKEWEYLEALQKDKAEQEHTHVRTQRKPCKMGRLVGRIQESVDLLCEYRTALISAAAMRKIVVRGEVKPMEVSS